MLKREILLWFITFWLFNVIVSRVLRLDHLKFVHHRNLHRTLNMHTKLSLNHSICKKNRDRAYKWHRALVAQQNQIKCQDYLQQVLQYALNLRKVIFIHCNCFIMNQELKKIWCWESNWKSCSLNRKMHNTFQLSSWYDRVTTRSSRSKMFFEATFVDFMMILLSSSNFRVQKLIMKACDRIHDTWFVKSSEFNELTSIISMTFIFLTHLRKLRLTTCDWHRKNQQAIAMINFLSQVKCLECLYLTCDHSVTSESQINHFLSQCHFLNLLILMIESNIITDKDLLSIFCDISKIWHLILKDVWIKRSHWRIFINEVKSSLNLTSLYMHLFFDYDNIYRLKDDLKIYIKSENNVDNFLHLKKSHSFSDIATAFCTKDLDEIFEMFWNDLLEDYD